MYDMAIINLWQISSSNYSITLIIGRVIMIEWHHGAHEKTVQRNQYDLSGNLAE